MRMWAPDSRTQETASRNMGRGLGKMHFMRLPGSSTGTTTFMGFSSHEPDNAEKQGYSELCPQREDELACYEVAKPHADGLGRAKGGPGC